MSESDELSSCDDDEEELHQPTALDEESDDSDKELQVAFKAGLIKPGLYAASKPETPLINNVEGMLEKLEEIEQKNMDWLERLDVTVERKSRNDPIFSQGLTKELAISKAAERTFTVHNDFKRELMFLTQAKEGVLKAMPLLKKDSVSTIRPNDYFAEMAKKDEHMKKIREKILSLHKRREASVKHRTQMKLKKYGKKVQHAVELERKKKKKEILETVKKYRKGQKDRMEFLDDDKPSKGNRPGGKSSQFQKKVSSQQNSRDFRNKKFGFGGKKRGMKSNTRNSTDSFSRFKGGNAGMNKRPGKQRRQNLKHKG